MATSTKWRLNIVGSNVDGIVAIAEWEVYTNGVNLCTGGTASADSVNGTDVAANAFDGNPLTYWERIHGSPNPVLKWLEYDFATTVANPTHYIITCRAGHARPPGNHTLEYWNGAGWVVYWTQPVTIASWATNETQTFTPTGPPLSSRPRSAFGAQKPARHAMRFR